MKVGTSCSNKSNVTSGIPQGSILGPTLFVVYINDFPNLTSQCKMFADDFIIYSKSFNHDIVQMDISNMLNIYINIKKIKIICWSSNWCLYFNINKCSVLHSGEKNTYCNFFMSIGEVYYKINNSLLVKDLGVIFYPIYIYMK